MAEIPEEEMHAIRKRTNSEMWPGILEFWKDVGTPIDDPRWRELFGGAGTKTRPKSWWRDRWFLFRYWLASRLQDLTDWIEP